MMSESDGLANSRRRFDKITYTPITLHHNDDRPSDADDARRSVLTTAAMLRTLRMTPAEAGALHDQVTDPPVHAAVDAIAAIAAAPPGPAALAASRHLVTLPTSALAAATHALGRLRSAAANEYSRLFHHHANELAREQPVDPSAPRPGGADPRSRGPGLRPPNPPMTQPRPPDPPTRAIPVANPPRPAPPRPTATTTGQSAPAVPDPHVSQLRALAATHLPNANTADPAAMNSQLQQLSSTPAAVVDALTRCTVEPIGLLHLERLVMTPIDIERGELVYSLPLAPKEKVTLAHREWATTSDEFQRYLEDYLENFSEHGVAQADDIAMGSTTEQRHANDLSLSSTPSTTGATTLTAPISVNASTTGSTVQDKSSRDQSVEHARTITGSASSRAVQDQKVSFTVTTTSGAEDFTARLLENPHTDQALRIDYFRRMRKWRTDLYRYDVRMTYDVVLPDPGHWLRERQMQLSDLDADLNAPFTLNLVPSQLTPDNWTAYADAHGAAVPPPPAPTRAQAFLTIGQNVPIIETPNAEKSTWNQDNFAGQLQFDIPADQQLSALSVEIYASAWRIAGDTPSSEWIAVSGGGPGVIDADANGIVHTTYDYNVDQMATTGTVALGVTYQHIKAGHITATATLTPTDAAIQQWRQRAWQAIYDKAYASYLADRERLRQQRTALTKAIAATDAVALRRLEREQIMLLVLQWLFPGFGTAADPLNVTSDGDVSGDGLDTDQWTPIVEYGEYVKFVQSAIDWENVLVLLYPYFWGLSEFYDAKLLLDHPDPQHKEFLRAGAARVVLAIQPGFEEQVISLLNKGEIGTLDDRAAIARIAADVRDARSQYNDDAEPPAADGYEQAWDDAQSAVDNQEFGILLDTWYDYTPTSALDTEVIAIPLRTRPENYASHTASEA
jgi:hypothetical protein